MLVFKEVRKQYLKKAAVIAVCIWAVVIAATAVISVVNAKKQVAQMLLPNDDTVSSAISGAVSAQNNAEALAAVQKSLPGNFGSESAKAYGASVVADEGGNVLWQSESYLLLTGEDGTKYYVPLEGYLTNEQIAQVESLFTEQPRYSNAMGSDAGDMYDVELVAECTFEGSVVTGIQKDGEFIPVSMDAYKTSGGSTTVFERQDAGDEGQEIQVTVSAGEMAIRSSGPRAQTSDNLTRSQACTEKAEALAGQAAQEGGAKAGGKYQTAVTRIQAGGKAYFVVAVGYADLGLIVKDTLIRPLSPILLFLLLAAAAFIADSRARKKTGKNPERPEV